MGTMTFPFLVKSLKAKELTNTIKTWRKADFCQALNVCEFDWRSTGPITVISEMAALRGQLLCTRIAWVSNRFGEFIYFPSAG